MLAAQLLFGYSLTIKTGTVQIRCRLCADKPAVFLEKPMARAVSLLERLMMFVTVTLFVLIVAVVILQVLGRTPFFTSYIWTEEVSRFLVLYLVAAACGVALLRGEMVNVDFFLEKLPPRGRAVAAILVNAFIIGLSVLMISPGLFYLQVTGFEKSVILGVSMSVIRVIVLIIPINLILFALINIAHHANALRRA